MSLQDEVSACKLCDEEGKMVRHTSQDEQSQGRQKEERRWESWRDEGKKKEDKCKR